MKTQAILDMLESIGLHVLDEKEDSDLNELYRIQDKVTDGIVDMLEPVEDRDKAVTAVTEFLIGIDSRKQDTEMGISEEQYQEFLRVLKTLGIKARWENAPKRYELFHHHRGLSVKDGKPVVGFLWMGSNSAYIMPCDNGIGIDEKTSRLTAYVVEVHKETVATDMCITDDSGIRLFDGDVVKIGDDVFTIDMMDINNVKRLFSLERKTKGLIRIKANYMEKSGD